MNSTDESNHDIMLVTLLTDIDSINAGAGILRAFPEMTEEEVAEFNKKNREARKIVNSTIYKVVDNYFKQDSVPNTILKFEYEKMEKEYNLFTKGYLVLFNNKMSMILGKCQIGVLICRYPLEYFQSFKKSL